MKNPGYLIIQIECMIYTIASQTVDIYSQLHQMVIAPHTRLTAWNLLTRRNVIPAVGAMIDRVE